MDTTLLKELEAVPLFSGIKQEDLPGMLACLNGYTKTYRKNEYILMEKENIRIIGVVLEGAVDMVKEDVWGNTTTLVRLPVTRLFGESFVCSTNNHTIVSFRAARHCKILFMPFDRVMHTCSNACIFHHQLIENMVIQIAEKNRELMEKVEVIAQKNLRQKILAYLSQQSQKQKSRYFEIPLGRVELADFLCADRSALTRELTEMKKEGLIDFDKNMFTLPEQTKTEGTK